MNKRVSLKFYVLIAFFLSASVGFAQDTIKSTTVKPPVTTPVYKRPHAIIKTPVTATQTNDSSMANIPAVVADRSLNGQYQYLLSKTYRYQQPMVSAFYKVVTDTLKVQRKQVKDLKSNLAAMSDSVNKLKAEITDKTKTISSSTAQQDDMSFLGLTLPKSTYNLMMWGLVAALALALTIVILTTAKHKHEARYRIKLFDDLSDEFQTYKAKANEKEKKLARELQTERNKLDELLGRE